MLVFLKHSHHHCNPYKPSGWINDFSRKTTVDRGCMDYRHDDFVYFLEHQYTVWAPVHWHYMDSNRWIIFLQIFVCVHLKKERCIHLGWQMIKVYPFKVNIKRHSQWWGLILSIRDCGINVAKNILTAVQALLILLVWVSWCNLMTDVSAAGLRVAERVHGVLGSDTDVWLECLPCGCVCVWQKSAPWHPLLCHWGTAKASLSLVLHSQSNLQGITIHSTLTSIYTQHKAC